MTLSDYCTHQMYGKTTPNSLNPTTTASLDSSFRCRPQRSVYRYKWSESVDGVAEVSAVHPHHLAAVLRRAGRGITKAGGWPTACPGSGAPERSSVGRAFDCSVKMLCVSVTRKSIGHQFDSGRSDHFAPHSHQVALLTPSAHELLLLPRKHDTLPAACQGGLHDQSPPSAGY